MDITPLCIHTVKIQTNEAAKDEKGGSPDSWQIRYNNVAARIQPIDARERVKWGGLPTIATHRIYVGDGTLSISEADRVVYGDRTFRILGVRNPDELDQFLILNCEEIR